MRNFISEDDIEQAILQKLELFKSQIKQPSKEKIRHKEPER